MWCGRGSGRQGGARHCTNDLDALGRVCSALPGSMAGGMEAPTPTTTLLHPPAVPPPSRSLSAPAGGTTTHSPPPPHSPYPLVAVVPGCWLTIPWAWMAGGAAPLGWGVVLVPVRGLLCCWWCGVAACTCSVPVVGVGQSVWRGTPWHSWRGAGGRAARAGGRSASASPRAPVRPRWRPRGCFP